jgi:uncharacterized membrane protein
MIRTARALYFTALGIWVGGMATLAFIVAPTLFRTARPVAGTVFGAILRGFGTLQVVLGVIAVVAVVLLMKAGELKTRTGGIRLGVLAVMLLLVVTSRFYLGPAIERERNSIANFDAIPTGVPAKARFDALHRSSVLLAGATLIAGAGLLALSAATSKSSDGA